MHACAHKGHKGLWPCELGLRLPLPKRKSRQGPLSLLLLKNPGLSLSSLSKISASLSLAFGVSPLSLASGLSPLSYLARKRQDLVKKGPNLAFEVACFLSLAFKALFSFPLRPPKC